MCCKQHGRHVLLLIFHGLSPPQVKTTPPAVFFFGPAEPRQHVPFNIRNNFHSNHFPFFQEKERKGKCSLVRLMYFSSALWAAGHAKRSRGCNEEPDTDTELFGTSAGSLQRRRGSWRIASDRTDWPLPCSALPQCPRAGACAQ